MKFFAHEDPNVLASTPWWQDELSVSVVLVLGFLSLLAVSHYLFKASFGLKTVLAMAYLLVVGMLCYRVAPILSIVALAAGLGVALVTTLVQLGQTRRPGQKK